jgi:hypothetical protein
LPASSTAPVPDPIRTQPRAGHPGFDARVYPGDAALRAWRDHSPYEWVGYYLVAPCQKGQTWSGKRAILEQIGWGTAVVFIGEQDWPVGARDTAANAATQCTSANLTADKGSADGMRADSAARAEGFADGSAIYLDIERVESISPKFEAYIRAWVGALAQRGHYVPGAYAHEKNADAIRAIVASEAAKSGLTGAPPMWVASRATFDVAAAPSASGFGYAHIWQGLFNTSETWGGVTLKIDANVATSANPSLPSRN